MKGWKLGVATLAVCTGIGGSAWGQNPKPAERQQSSRTAGRYSIVQTSWQDHEHDRDNRDRDNNRWRNDRRDRDNRAYRDDHDRGRWGYRGGNPDYGYRPYGTYQGPVYGYGGYGQPVYGQGGYGRYGYRGGYGYGNAAAQMGYQDGFSYGQNDAARGKRYDATGSEAYENADHGYNSSFGDRNAYRQEYRQAYQQGYSAGYNGGGYGRR